MVRDAQLVYEAVRQAIKLAERLIAPSLCARVKGGGDVVEGLGVGVGQPLASIGDSTAKGVVGVLEEINALLCFVLDVPEFVREDTEAILCSGVRGKRGA